MRIVLLLLVVLLALPLQAQDDITVTPVIVDLGGFTRFALSSDATQLAMFEESILLPEDMYGQYLPIQLYDETTGQMQQLTGHTAYVAGAQFVPGSNDLLTMHGNGDLHRWNIDDGSLQATLFTYVLAQGRRPLYLLPDNQSVLVSLPNSLTPDLAVIDTSNGYITQRFTRHFESYEHFQAYIGEVSPPDGLAAYALSPDGSKLIVATFRTNLWLWDVETGESRQILQSEEEIGQFNVRNIQFSPNSSLFYFYNRETESIHVWNAVWGQEVDVLPVNAPVFDLLDDDTLVWINEDGASLSVAPVARVNSVTTINLADYVPANIIADFEADPLAQRNLLLMDAANGHIAVGGFRNDVGLGEPGQNAIFIITLPEG